MKLLGPLRRRMADIRVLIQGNRQHPEDKTAGNIPAVVGSRMAGRAEHGLHAPGYARGVSWTGGRDELSARRGRADTEKSGGGTAVQVVSGEG